MGKGDITNPLCGLCSFQDFPELYQSAFLNDTAHKLPGAFLPVEVDWFVEIVTMPFWVIYALPPLTLPVACVLQFVQQPESYVRFFQIFRQQNVVEMALMLGLLALLGLLLIYCAWVSWNGASAFVRTWQAHQLQRRNRNGFGLVMLPDGLVARLIDNIDGHNCFWFPREAIADIIWQRIREEGAKHSRWVYRTRVCYLSEHKGKTQKYWLTLKGQMVKTGHPTGDVRSDRALYDQLYD